MNGLRVVWTADARLVIDRYCLLFGLGRNAKGDDTSRLSTLEMICLKSPRLAEQSISTSSANFSFTFQNHFHMRSLFNYLTLTIYEPYYHRMIFNHLTKNDLKRKQAVHAEQQCAIMYIFSCKKIPRHKPICKFFFFNKLISLFRKYFPFLNYYSRFWNIWLLWYDTLYWTTWRRKKSERTGQKKWRFVTRFLVKK